MKLSWIKNIRFSGIIVVIVATDLIGCRTVRLPYDYDRTADFTVYKTISWLPQTSDTKEEYRGGNSMIEKRFRKALEDSLSQKGFTLVPEDPDIYVAYSSQIEVKEKTFCSYRGNFFSDHHRHGHHSCFGGSHSYGSCYTYDQNEATLIIDMIDAANSELIWRGWHPEIVHGPTISENVIRAAVAKIMVHFPPIN